MNRADIVTIVRDAVRGQMEIDGHDDVPVDEPSVLLGSDALVDSLGLVNVIIEVEQVLFEKFDLSVTLVDEKAMSERNSPFRTVGSLSDYAHGVIESTAATG